MKTIKIGEEFTALVKTDRRHTADQFGNPGLFVVATPALIWLLEVAAHSLLARFLDPGEGTVGTEVNVKHLAAAPEATLVTVTATVCELEGRRVTFDVRALDGDCVLMSGKHARAVVRLRDFHKRLKQKGQLSDLR